MMWSTGLARKKVDDGFVNTLEDSTEEKALTLNISSEINIY